MHKRNLALMSTAILCLASCATLKPDGKPTLWGRIVQAAAEYDRKQQDKPAATNTVPPSTSTTSTNLPTGAGGTVVPPSPATNAPPVSTSVDPQRYPPTWKTGWAGAPVAGQGMYPTSAACDDGMAYTGPGANEWWLKIGGQWQRQAAEPPPIVIK